MTQRLDFFTIGAGAMKAFGAVSGYLGECGLPGGLIDLVYLRVSLINGCAYCIDKHSRDLLKQGMSVDKLVLVPVWYEAGELFTARERAALKWAETVTRVAETAVPDADYAEVRAEFSEQELVDLTIAIGLMNALNRQAISFRLVPAAAKH
ncbi:MAG: carboxymuconolactone decarboxylase family protein [Rhodospirillaceae bacterium]|nr:carboxymuconolactone decarboxylase family protein [Rhodospirillales bacterium]